MKICLGVTGSIAAYRSPDLVKELVARGHEVKVVLTESAEKFVTRATLETFSGQALLSNDPFGAGHEGTDHISTARWADRVLIYGATANFLARYAQGAGDDFLMLQLLATRAPVFVAPAMNPVMWEHPALQSNLATLKSRGVHFVGPIPGVVACGERGSGHIADTDEIANRVEETTPRNFERALAGKPILISVGPMQSRIDSARRVQNLSSGKMGLELARAARDAGAQVTLLLGPVDSAITKASQSFDCKSFKEASDYAKLLDAEFPKCDVFISNAAVLDFEVVEKIGKLPRSSLSGDSLQLETRPVPDFVGQCARTKKNHQLVIAFAAESGNEDNILSRAHEKLVAKGVDALVANPLSENSLGAEQAANRAWIFKKGSKNSVALEPQPKAQLARQIVSALFQI